MCYDDNCRPPARKIQGYGNTYELPILITNPNHNPFIPREIVPKYIWIYPSDKKVNYNCRW